MGNSLSHLNLSCCRDRKLLNLRKLKADTSDEIEDLTTIPALEDTTEISNYTGKNKEKAKKSEGS